MVQLFARCVSWINEAGIGCQVMLGSVGRECIICLCSTTKTGRKIELVLLVRITTGLPLLGGQHQVSIASQQKVNEDFCSLFCSLKSS